mgnify:CR=1 FL=1
MSLHLTPEILAAAYTYLRSTQPFHRWKLPPAHEIKFRVVRSKDFEAMYDDKKSKRDRPGQAPQVLVSSFNVGHSYSLMEAMAHEMVHIYLFAKKVRAYHGPEFERCKRQICKVHGFDPKRF